MTVDADCKKIQLSFTERRAIVEKKATCPFIGAVVATGDLPVRNSITEPLASVDDVTHLGNSGGGDLGEVLKIFAKGNHARMFDDSGKPSALLPVGLFSLDFPGSQGSHPGHSGILQGNPAKRGSGRFSQSDFDRLVNYVTDGFIKQSDVAAFIAENLARDPDSKVNSKEAAKLVLQDISDVHSQGWDLVKEKLKSFFTNEPSTEQSDQKREFAETLTKVAGENNLVGAAGEFGLLFAFFANKPDAKTIDSEPTLTVADLTLMFKEKKLPKGWDTWEKTKIDWIKNTAQLLISAARAFDDIKNGNS
ncbi:hypothetical protein [Nitrosomonas marina]|uniref:Uncharacterized protein n=1 Tax=Nitrosomonas marina TaxID=917 RepID=A0A1H8CDU0_9PROT|nr:hypothetical protein [Nitrosomonas marina]SEM92277.1 hypothetical protein SAMN05216325_104112 [Nitrosomonas marina]